MLADVATQAEMLKPLFVHRLLRARDYQDRAEMVAVQTWWRNLGGVGVCSLEGIGGAGKTSVVERFLRVLPGAMSAEPAIRKDASLSKPDAVFVYSFYDAPHPDDLFRTLAVWLGVASNSTDRLPYNLISARLAAVGSALIVLDGLEKAQDDGSRGQRFGSITDPWLRDFLFKVADGQMPNVGVLVTTRFKLEDLFVYNLGDLGANAHVLEPLSFYYRVSVDRLSVASCTALLERLGVQGTAAELERVADHCGYHALTVDLFGGYIVRFLGAAADLALSSRYAIGHDHAGAPAGDPLGQYVHEQTLRFGRVAERYREALARSDPAALTFLQRICLFRLGATAEFLAQVLNAIDDARKPDGQGATLSAGDVQTKLEALVGMHLLEGTGTSPDGKVIYTTHPAVREGFLAGLEEDSARQTHEAARLRMAEVSLTLRPGERYPSDRIVLDQWEEVLHHTLMAGHREEAFRIYEGRLGGFSNLCWALGDYERGERICRSMLQQGVREKRLPNEWAMYLVALGRTDAALDCLGSISGAADTETLGGILLLVGRLGDAARAGAGEAVGGTAAYARALLGDVDNALLQFSRLLPNKNWRPSAPLLAGSPLWHLPTLLHCIVLARAGQDDEAKRGAEFIRREMASTLRSATSMYDAAARLVLAEVATGHEDFDEVDRQVSAAQAWAIERDAKEILCWSWLVKARAANIMTSMAGESAEVQTASVLEATNAGLRLARQSGFSIYHADLALERARSLLYVGDVDAAEYFIRLALYGLVPASGSRHAYDAQANNESIPVEDRGIFPPGDSGLPRILAITNSLCGYAWGRAQALHLSAEVFLLRAGRLLGSGQVDKSALGGLAGAAGAAVDEARHCIQAVLALREQTPDGRYKEALALKRRLDLGMITPYPLTSKQAGSSLAQLNATGRAPQRRIFISYAHRDNDHADPQQKWLDRLLEHLAPLVHQRDLAIWSDRDIGMGDAWHEQIQRSLAHASAAVLMVTPAYLASEYIRNNELPVLLRNAASQGLMILPIILRPCAFAETRFRYPDPVNGPEEFSLGSLQAANDLTRPLIKMAPAEQDEALLSVARRLLELSRAASAG